MMNIVLNGVPRQVPDGIMLADLLEQMKLDARTVVAEVSGAIVPRERFAATVLHADAKVELVRLLGGG